MIMQSKLCVIILKGFHGFSAIDSYKFVSVINIIICTNSRKREKNLPFLHNSMEYVSISILVFLLVNSSHCGDAKFKFMQEGNRAIPRNRVLKLPQYILEHSALIQKFIDSFGTIAMFWTR